MTIDIEELLVESHRRQLGNESLSLILGDIALRYKDISQELYEYVTSLPRPDCGCAACAGVDWEKREQWFAEQF